MKSRNERHLEMLIDRLAYALESLEEYIRHAGYYSDWHSKEQFYRRMFGDINKWDLDHDEEQIFSNLSISGPSFEEEPESIRKETQKEFYKWIDYSGITAENCPEKVKHYLNEINEMLEGRGDKFCQAYKENNIKLHKVKERKENASVFWEADRETRKFFFGEPIPSDWTKKHYDVEIKGNAEQGQKIFQEIKNSIVSQPEWTFPWKKKYLLKLKEKIRELENKKGQVPLIQPKEDLKPGYIIDTFNDILREDLELYIQKLDYYPGWKAHEWENKEWWEKKSIQEVKGLVRIGLKTLTGILSLFEKNDPDYYPVLINKLKTKFIQWQKERKIEIGNSPRKLRKILLKFNEILDGNHPWKNMKDKEKNNHPQEISKIIIELSLEISELTKKYQLKITDLDPEFKNWESKIKHANNISEAQKIQERIREKIKMEENKHQTPTTSPENSNKLSLSVKIFIGTGIIGLILAGIIIIRQIIKRRKHKK